ncbi:MAG: hypothetical protein HC915_09510 [Anaerolineae bacterium]|nr:hypothetical protein [Anaerolineae bacterium]
MRGYRPACAGHLHLLRAPVSKQAAAKRPYFMAVWVGAGQMPKAIVTADAIWCGTCRPQPEPIPMPDLF